MPDIFAILTHYASYFPLAAVICLLLAACNVPISEDLIIITGALLSREKPELLVYNLAGIYTGVIIGDFFGYWVATRVRKGVAKTNIFSRLVPGKVIDRMHHYLDKYGIFTFIVCRFIPFGIRNALVFSSGFFNLRFRFFALYDIIAAMISMNTLFFLTYHFGQAADRPIEIAGIILFIALVSSITSLIIRFILQWRKNIKKGEKKG